MLTFLMAGLGVMLLVVGVITWILRRRGKYIPLTDDERKTAEEMHKAFGDDTRWGLPGGVESEAHEDFGGSADSGSTPD